MWHAEYMINDLMYRSGNQCDTEAGKIQELMNGKNPNQLTIEEKIKRSVVEKKQMLKKTDLLYNWLKEKTNIFEQTIKFWPTYKMESGKYKLYKSDSCNKGRLPGYADRILYYLSSNLNNEYYKPILERQFYPASDHLPIESHVEIGPFKIITISWNLGHTPNEMTHKKEMIKYCKKYFEEQKEVIILLTFQECNHNKEKELYDILRGEEYGIESWLEMSMTAHTMTVTPLKEFFGLCTILLTKSKYTPTNNGYTAFATFKGYNEIILSINKARKDYKFVVYNLHAPFESKEKSEQAWNKVITAGITTGKKYNADLVIFSGDFNSRSQLKIAPDGPGVSGVYKKDIPNCATGPLKCDGSSCKVSLMCENKKIKK